MRRGAAIVSILGCLLLPDALAARPLVAQERAGDRVFVGAGGGYGVVYRGGGAGQRSVRPQLHGRLGVRLTRSLVGVVELGAFGLGDEEPRPSDVSVDDRGILVWHRMPEILRTSTLLLGALLAVGERGYLRPAVGLGRNSVAVYGPWPRMDEAGTTSGVGPAAGAAAGYLIPAGSNLRVAVEAVAHWSGGEESSVPRRILGLQLVPMLSW